MLVLFGLVAASLVVAQQSTCSNFGVSDGSNCLCPPGFGGSSCDVPACGGNIFNGAQRSVSQNSSTGGMSLSGCACESGWGGSGCNVCQSAGVCQSAFAAARSSNSGSSSSLLGAGELGNQTLTCNTQSRVYAAQEMSCAVINPTLQAIFPLQANLNILRTLDPTLTPSPNLTSFGSAGSALAQLIYDGVEQFYCSATDCKQNVGNDTTEWVCSSLKCQCRDGTAFCGANPNMNLAPTLNSLSGTLTVSCTTSSASCSFKQNLLQALFGSNGLGLSNCMFGECVRQSVIDSAMGITPQAENSGSQLSGGVIAGLVVVGVAGLLVGLLVAWGCVTQGRARKGGMYGERVGGRRVGVEWRDIGYAVHPSTGLSLLRRRTPSRTELGSTSVIELRDVEHGEKPLPVLPADTYTPKSKHILSGLSGQVRPGEMLAILGPSGAGKTTLISILAGRAAAMDGRVRGDFGFFIEGSSGSEGRVRVGFVDQTDVLPATLTVYESLLFAARLRMPEHTPDSTKRARVETVIRQLGLQGVANSRIGGDGRHRGLSGGERRRVSIALEIVAGVEVLVLDEPTSGLDSVSAGKVAQVLRDLAKDEENPVAVIASIHQPSSRLYHQFDSVLLLARGQQVYFGPGGTAPVRALGGGMEEGYNVADFLLEVASDERVPRKSASPRRSEGTPRKSMGIASEAENEIRMRSGRKSDSAEGSGSGSGVSIGRNIRTRTQYAATFLTQVEVLCGREWKNLKRDKTLFFMHLAVACVLGLFTGGLYFHVKTTISGFQNRVGSLFFLGSLLAFSSLSALYNLVEVRGLFTRERAGGYYSPAAWLASRVLFDVVPLRIVPTIVMATITYWMVGLSPDAARFFKALLVLMLFALAMTLFNFLLACVFRNGGVAILLSALFNLFTMTYAGFFVNLSQIPPVLRWLQYFSILKYCLEALAVNEVGSGLMIQDTLEGVPVNVSAALIMELLFGFGANHYYR
ncbi:ATP-dependent permease [Ceratobasidium sp. AG-Ba]|nr:ATP-dependent permease [Ceratobasidium sp. AG-Ba]